MPATPVFTPDYAAFLALPTTARLDVLADQVELALTGGQATDDSPYAWPLLRLCVQEAFDKVSADKETANLAILQADYLTRKKDEQDSYFLDLKARSDFWETPDRWIQSFPVHLLLDTDRAQQFFILPPALVNLRRYQNLPTESGVRDIQARHVNLRRRYRFAYTAQGAQAYQRLPGGTLGRHLFHLEQNTSAATPNQYRCYLTPPTSAALIPATVALDMYCVIRGDRTSGLPAPPLQLVEDYDIVRLATDLALLRARQDKIPDASPIPSQAQ